MLKIKKHTQRNVRPIMHFTSEKNWINAPNGFSFYDGKYHLFYQYNPMGIVWGNMSWGHAVSEDLVYWEHLEVALYPDKPYDMEGVYSGSAIVIDDIHLLYYTGVKRIGKTYLQVQCMAASSDGRNYKKYRHNPVLKADKYGDGNEFRDPKIWLKDSKIYMIAATNTKGKGKANIYYSENGTNFNYVTGFTKENTGFMWECPDLFLLEQQWTLMFSAMGMQEEIVENISFIAPVEFDYEGNVTKVYEHEKMDYGVDFYAPQTMADVIGRRIVIGWLRMQVPISENQNWVGMMSLPRVIKLVNREIHYEIIEEIFRFKKILYRTDRNLVIKACEIGENSIVESFQLLDNTPYEFKASFDAAVSFSLSNGTNGGLLVEYHPKKRKVSVTRSIRGISKADKKTGTVTESFDSPELLTEYIQLQIVMDNSVAEIFINEGRYVISTIFSNTSNENIVLINCSAELNELEVAELQKP